MVETINFLSEVKYLQLSLGALFIQRKDLSFLFLDDLFVCQGLIFLIGLRLLEFLLDEVEVLFELEFGFGQLVVLGCFGLD